MDASSIQQFFLKLSIMLVPGLMAITCHEVSHGFVAYRLGDNTAKMLGRLTLNPLKHLDIVGTIMIFVVGFGWAKPVPVDYRNLRRPKTDMIWVAAAGPITNFTLAILSAAAMRGMVSFVPGVSETSLLAGMMKPTIWMLAFSVYINLVLGLFNLIPVPPLDGGRVAVGLLPYRLAATWARIEPVGIIIIMALILLTNFFGYVIGPPLTFLVNLLAGQHSDLVFKVTELMAR